MKRFPVAETSGPALWPLKKKPKTKEDRENLRKEVCRIVQNGMVYVDQGMGHGHFKVQIQDEQMSQLVDCLRALFPKGRVRLEI